MRLKSLLKRRIKASKLPTLYKISKAVKEVEFINDSDEEFENNEVPIDVSENLAEKACAEFVDAGLSRHLSGCIGGNKKPAMIQTILNRSVQCLLWCHYELKGCEVDLQKQSIVDWLKEFISGHYSIINEYAMYLEKVKYFSPSTICNHLYDLVSVAQWVVYFNTSSSNLPDIDISGFKIVIAAIKKNYSRQQKFLRTDNDVVECIKKRRFPQNGLKDLMECVESELKWVRVFFKNDWATRINEPIYKRIISILFASLYVFSPQGRKGGLESLKYSDGEVMLQQGHVNSKKFKTRSTYGYQPC